MSETGCCPLTEQRWKIDCFEQVIVRVDGSHVPIIKSVKRVLIDGKDKILETFIDITAQKQVEEALQSEKDNLAAIFASSPVGKLLLNEEITVVDANSVIAGLVSKIPSEVINESICSGLGCVHSHECEKDYGSEAACTSCRLRGAITEVLTTGTSMRGVEAKLSLIIDGQEFHPWLRVSAERISINGHKHVIVAVDDISELKRTEEALERANVELEKALIRARELAAIADISRREAEDRAVEMDYKSSHDALTGLFNRLEFEQRVGRRIKSRRSSFAVIFMDLDKFKLVNDSLGHEIGDMLLIECGNRLISCLRSSDVMAHAWEAMSLPPSFQRAGTFA